MHAHTLRIALPLALLLCATSALSRTIVVAKSGGDYATIQAGLNAANAGDSVLVRAGIYGEFVTWPRSGSAAGGAIVLKAFGDGDAVIDGAGLTVSPSHENLLLIDGMSYVAVIGLEIRNSITASGQIFNKGIMVTGASQHVLIKQCRVHAIENNNTTTSAGANAIGVFGTDGQTAISDVVIDSTEVYNCKTGYSESISIDGNVDGFRVSNCYVHDNNNIGILFAGHYGECPNPANDQARHGVIADNRVERCSSCSNPSYAGDCSADGIYSDGGGKSVIERNVVIACDIGMEAGAELAGAIDDSVVIRDNLIYTCNTGGIFIGGYARGRGWTIQCRVENNTLYQNDMDNTGSGEILIQKAHDNAVRNNIMYTNAQKVGLSVAFDSTNSYNNTVEYNLFYSSAGGTGIDGSALGTNARNADPLFVANGTNFHLQATSPAINSCDPTYTPAVGELDLDRLTRKAGSAVDIGAYESGSSAVSGMPGVRTSSASVTAARVVIPFGRGSASRAVFVSARHATWLTNGRHLAGVTNAPTR
jgi:hypothetical protein